MPKLLTTTGSELPPQMTGADSHKAPQLSVASSPESQLQGYPFALGRQAVDAELQRATNLLDGEGQTSQSIPPSAYLNLARSHIKGTLKTNDSGEISSLFRPDEMPEWLRRATHSYDDSSLLAPNLSSKGKIDDRTAINVLQWHNSQLSGRQQAFEIEILPMMKEIYTAAVHQAVANGWLPTVVLNRLQRLDSTPTFIDDGFESIRTATVAFYDSESIGLSPLGKNLTGAYMHEASHVITGVDVLPKKTDENARTASGLNRIFRKRHRFNAAQDLNNGARALDEAVTERISTALTSGDIDTPPKIDDMEHYVREQALLNTLCSNGVKPVDIRLFVAAYIEDGADRDKLGDKSAAAQLVQALEEAFPRLDIMFKLTYLKDELEPTMKLIKKLYKEGAKGPLPEAEVGLYRRMHKRPLGSY